MRIDEIAIVRLDALVKRGFELGSHPGGDSDLFRASYHGWQTQGLAAIEDLAGTDTPYARNFALQTNRSGALAASIGAAILEGLRNDIANGYLRQMADLVVAEVFTDFLDMAEHLLTLGYHIPAASLSGAVLEDGLRRLCGRRVLPVKTNDDISVLNGRLAAKGAYSTLVRRRVEVWATTRNTADHKDFAQLKPSDVAEMLPGVRGFLADHLG